MLQLSRFEAEVLRTSYRKIVPELRTEHKLIKSLWKCEYLRRWMVKAPHCTDDAWKFPLSTCRYRVLTVWDLKRLNKATLVPLATQTAKKSEFFKISDLKFFFIWRSFWWSKSVLVDFTVVIILIFDLKDFGFLTKLWIVKKGKKTCETIYN